MSAITAAAVKELREITGVAMMDCKKALVECNGDLEEAKEFLRKKGQAKALKKSSRETREGAVEIRVDENGDHMCAVIQAEDELAAAGMVVGGGWQVFER